MSHYIYGLCFDLDGDTTFFYIGHTNDVQRRWLEHNRDAFNEDSSSFETSKYRFIRELDRRDIKFQMIVLEEITSYDQDGEYEWILKFARENQEQGLNFFGYPLTNMKAGDFTSEILDRKHIVSRTDIKSYREMKTFLREVNYTREEEELPRNEGARAILLQFKEISDNQQAIAKKEAERAIKRAVKMKNNLEKARRARDEYLDTRIPEIVLKEGVTPQVALQLAMNEWYIIQEQEDTKWK